MTAKTAEPTVREHVIPAWAVELLGAKVAKANRRAARAGIEGRYTVELAELFDEEREDEFGVKRIYHMARVNVIGDLLFVPGFTFAATVDWSLKTPLLRRNPALPEDAIIAAPASKLCEHCGTERHRNDTYLVREDATGKLIQVGRNCLAAFCGINPGWVSVAYDIPEVDDEELARGPRGYGEPFADLSVVELLTVAHGIVEYDGSFKPAAFEDKSTKNGVWLVIGDTITDPSWRDYERQRTLRAFIKEHKAEFVEKAIADAEWAKALEPGDNDFLYNLKTVAEAGLCTGRHVGLVVAIIPAHDHEVIKRTEAAKRGPVPTGNGILIEGVVEKLWLKATDFGDTYKMWVRLDNGSRVYSTVPQGLFDAYYAVVDRDDVYARRAPDAVTGLHERRVRFIASVEAARDDVTTGFAKRPRKAELIEGGE